MYIICVTIIRMSCTQLTRYITLYDILSFPNIKRWISQSSWSSSTNFLGSNRLTTIRKDEAMPNIVDDIGVYQEKVTMSRSENWRWSGRWGRRRRRRRAAAWGRSRSRVCARRDARDGGRAGTRRSSDPRSGTARSPAPAQGSWRSVTGVRFIGTRTCRSWKRFAGDG